jgi:hypothetical protein
MVVLRFNHDAVKATARQNFEAANQPIRPIVRARGKRAPEFSPAEPKNWAGNRLLHDELYTSQMRTVC